MSTWHKTTAIRHAKTILASIFGAMIAIRTAQRTALDTNNSAELRLNCLYIIAALVGAILVKVYLVVSGG